MKIFTLLFFCLMATAASAQIDGNAGSRGNDRTTGIEQIDAQFDVKAYQFGESLMLSTSAQTGFEGDVRLYTTSGRLIMTQPVRNQVEQISVNGLAQGIYFVEMRIESQAVVKKVFIRKQ